MTITGIHEKKTLSDSETYFGATTAPLPCLWHDAAALSLIFLLTATADR